MDEPQQRNARRARVPAFAKINLTLKVLYKRADGYHELRTVFQTISIADRLTIEYRPKGARQVELHCGIDIPNNLAARAAEAVIAETGAKGSVRIDLEKRIPMGGGLGGGSTDAAAVLLALPALIGKHIPTPKLTEIAASLGSDVPFFLLGGAALGLGRGEELYPFPEPKPTWGLLLTPGIHVSTPDAYRELSRDLTVTSNSFRINEFQHTSWSLGNQGDITAWYQFCQNDFERTVFQKHPQLLRLKRKLAKVGAKPALMTGSGSALFGFFESRALAEAAASHLPQPVLFRTLTRSRYRALFARSLEEFRRKDSWPPQSRYAK